MYPGVVELIQRSNDGGELPGRRGGLHFDRSCTKHEVVKFIERPTPAVDRKGRRHAEIEQLLQELEFADEPDLGGRAENIVPSRFHERLPRADPAGEQAKERDTAIWGVSQKVDDVVCHSGEHRQALRLAPNQGYPRAGGAGYPFSHHLDVEAASSWQVLIVGDQGRCGKPYQNRFLAALKSPTGQDAARPRPINRDGTPSVTRAILRRVYQGALLSHRMSNLGGLNLLCLLEWFCHKSFKTQEIQAVAHHSTVFGQFLALLPRHEFDAESREHQRGQRLRVMSRWAQFVALGLGQLTGRQSLRDIVANLQVQSSKLYHLGVRTVSRSSLARVNAEQPYTLYEAVFSRLLSRCQQQAPGHGFRFKHKLYAVDASTIDLCLALFPWATFRRTKAAVKLHVGLDQAGQLPSFVSLTEGKRGDVTVARTWQFPAGSVVVADRAYLDFKWLHQLQTRSVTFVTRLKRGVRYRVTHEHDVQPETGVLADQRIELTSARSGKAYPDPLRRVVYRDPQTKNRYVFVTNNTTWVAKTIADIYKSRWQIELFFKWIKQHLKVKRFIGRSKNAVWTQLWIATCMYLLLAYLKFVLRLRWSLNQMLQVLQLNIFERRPLHELFTTHAPPNPDRPQLALAWT